MKVSSLSRWLGALFTALVVVLCAGQPSYGATTCSSISDQLSPSKSSIEITCLPAGTQHIGLAVMQNTSGAGLKYISIPATQLTYTPAASDPVVDAQAWSSSKAIGEWAGRKQTVPGGEAPKESPHEEPHEEPQEETHEELPSELPSGFRLGINAGGWGASTEAPDVLALGGTVRLDTPSGSLAAYESKGIKVIADMSGPYSSSGVSGVNTASYVARDVALVKANPHLYALETLNEPGGDWFWGSNSESSANREAYARLVISVHEALVKEFGSARPLQLCSYDGGHDSSDAFGEAWTKNTTALADCDGLTNHPYGGTGARSTAILGNRPLVERTIALTGKPVYVTEVGFPTKGPTGDSLQYSEGEQAEAIYNFAGWARSKWPHIAAVTFFGYRDESEGGGYGVEKHSGARKLAYTALKEVAEGAACTVCS
ncbi:MAG: hypothetical protein ACLQBB_00590 [Solirubrobacteraceae bacterium]